MQLRGMSQLRENQSSSVCTQKQQRAAFPRVYARLIFFFCASGGESVPFLDCWSVYFAISFLVVIMIPSPVIGSSSTPFSVKDILKLELQQQSQQHQLQLISCFGLSGALSQPGALSNKSFRSHSPPSCMLAGRDTPSPISSCLSESEERMAYLNSLNVQDRLTDSGIHVEVFGNLGQTHSADLRPETEQDEHDSSEYTVYWSELLWGC